MNTKDMEMVANVIVAAIKKTVAPMQDTMARLESEIVALKLQPKSLDYCGTYQRATEYRRNQGVTFKSQLWICTSDSARGIEPGTTDHWQLAEKSDAR